MQLAYVKALAEDVGGEPVPDVVVTVRPVDTAIYAHANLHLTQVPAFFSQFERQAVLDAIEIAGLKPIALINDGSAG